MDPDRTGAELPAVEHQVVGLATHLEGFRLEEVDVVGMGLAEGVVSGLGPAGGLVDSDEQGEVDNPQITVGALVHRGPAEVVAELAEHLAGGGPLVGDDEQEVAGLGGETLLQLRLLCLGEELGDRRLEGALGGDLQPHQALGAHLLGLVGEAVELVTAILVGLACGVDALDAGGTGKGLEFGGTEDVGEFGELHCEAQVGLVDAEAVHRLEPGDLDDLPRVLTGGAGRGDHGAADGLVHVVLVDEAHLGVELHELVLAVGAQVLVAQAARDLVVAVDSRHHQ